MTPDEIKAAIAEAVKAASEAQAAEFAKREAKLRKDLESKLSAKQAPKPDADDDDADLDVDPEPEPKPKGKQPGGAEAKRLAALEKKLAEQVARAEAAENARRVSERNTAIRAALAKHGIPADRVDLAFRAVTHPDDPLIVDIEGGWGRKFTDKYGSEVVQTIDEAVSSWAETDAGKAFKPAPPATGTGSQPPAQAPRGKDGGVDWSAIANKLSGGSEFY